MKKLSVLLLVLACSLFATLGTAAAHELATAGSLSAVLHIEPDDHVVSGTASPYELEFDDLANAFKPANCDCSLAARLNGKTVAMVQPKATDDQTAKGTIVFPKPGDYQMELTGKPKAGNSFPSFTMKFPAEVSAPKSGLSTKLLLIGDAGVLVVVAGAGGLIYHRTKRLKH